MNIAKTIKSGNLEFVKQLISSGIDINVQFKDKIYGSMTPLTHAINVGDLEMVKLLLSAGADPNLFSADEDGFHPLQFALGRFEMVKLLLEAGAWTDVSFNMGDDPGDFPFVYAVENDDIAVTKLLLEYGAKINSHEDIRTAMHVVKSHEMALFLINAGADIHTKGRCGFTPFHAACKDGRWEIVHLLLEKGANETEVDFQELSLEQIRSCDKMFLIHLPNYKVPSKRPKGYMDEFISAFITEDDFHAIEVMIKKKYIKKSNFDQWIDFATNCNSKKVLNYLLQVKK